MAFPCVPKRLLLAVASAGLLVAGCGLALGPTDGTVLSLARKTPPAPPQVVGKVVLGKIELIEIAKRGAPHNGVWPVRLRVRGEAISVDMASTIFKGLASLGGEKKNSEPPLVDFLVDGHVRKNDFGEWVIEYDAATVRFNKTGP